MIFVVDSEELKKLDHQLSVPLNYIQLLSRVFLEHSQSQQNHYNMHETVNVFNELYNVCTLNIGNKLSDAAVTFILVKVSGSGTNW